MTFARDLQLYGAAYVASLPDATRVHRFQYSLTQRVFLAFAAQPQPLDRKHICQLLGLGDLALTHALRSLEAKRCIEKTPGRYGFYQLVAGAKMPEDTRGKHPNSRGHRRKQVPA